MGAIEYGELDERLQVLNDAGRIMESGITNDSPGCTAMWSPFCKRRRLQVDTGGTSGGALWQARHRPRGLNEGGTTQLDSLCPHVTASTFMMTERCVK